MSTPAPGRLYDIGLVADGAIPARVVTLPDGKRGSWHRGIGIVS